MRELHWEVKVAWNPRNKGIWPRGGVEGDFRMKVGGRATQGHPAGEGKAEI